MKKKKAPNSELEKLCANPHPDDAIDPREFFKKSQPKDSLVKDRRLCTQVRQCLEMVLPDLLLDVCPAGFQVYSVDPAPDATHLRVTVAIATGEPEPALSLLEQSVRHIRSEVAGAIHRKKAPELSFVVVNMEEG